MNRFFQHQLWIANAAPDYLDKRSIFYPLKDKLLNRYSKRDGWDLQEITKECWQCDEDGIDWWNDGETCRYCGGTHIYEIKRFCLLRYQLGDRTYHRPMEIWEANEQGLTVPEEKRGIIEGHITHSDSGLNHEDGDKALRWLLVRYEPQTLIQRFINERKRLFHNWFWFKAEPWIARVLIKRFNLTRVNDDIPF